MRRILAPAPERPIAAVAPPSFSIIIPAYQAAAFIADAVESALTQAVAPAEVIVCDDGSTDELAKALRPFSGRITVLRKEHGGAASARNVATRSASSEFVAFLDADNIFLPGHLEAVGDLAAMRPDLDILTTDAFLELDGHIYGRYYRGKARFIVEDQRRGIIHQHFIFGNAAFRREALLAVGGYDETVLAEDTDLFLRMILGGSRVGLVDEPLCVYRIRSGTLSSNLPRSLRSGVVVLERARNHPSLTSEEQGAEDRLRASGLRVRPTYEGTGGRLGTTHRTPLSRASRREDWSVPTRAADAGALERKSRARHGGYRWANTSVGFVAGFLTRERGVTRTALRSSYRASLMRNARRRRTVSGGGASERALQSAPSASHFPPLERSSRCLRRECGRKSGGPGTEAHRRRARRDEGTAAGVGRASTQRRFSFCQCERRALSRYRSRKHRTFSVAEVVRLPDAFEEANTIAERPNAVGGQAPGVEAIAVKRLVH